MYRVCRSLRVIFRKLSTCYFNREDRNSLSVIFWAPQPKKPPKLLARHAVRVGGFNCTLLPLLYKQVFPQPLVGGGGRGTTGTSPAFHLRRRRVYVVAVVSSGSFYLARLSLQRPRSGSHQKQEEEEENRRASQPMPKCLSRHLNVLRVETYFLDFNH